MVTDRWAARAGRPTLVTRRSSLSLAPARSAPWHVRKEQSPSCESSPGVWCRRVALLSSVTWSGAHAAASSATSLFGLEEIVLLAWLS